jgi:aspartate/methionine/tyrosine aminotransferase
LSNNRGSSEAVDKLQLTEAATTMPGRPAFSNRIVGTLDPCVVLMKSMVNEYSHIWKDKGGIYALSQGVVYWGPPYQSAQFMQAELSDPDNALHQYGPDEGLQELRDALEVKLAAENGLTNHSVMITVGANQAYANCVLTLLGELCYAGGQPDVVEARGQGRRQQQKAVVFAPYYFNHVMAIQMCGGPDSLRVGPCSDDGVPDFDWLEDILRTDPTIQMVTIVNPGNPTGVALDRPVLQRAVDLCRDHSCWLVLDCTYEHFVAHGPTATTASTTTTTTSAQSATSTFGGCFDGEPHVIHIFSFSKSFALAGYRCGYLALHRGAAGLYEQMLKVQDTVPIAPSRISQVAALGALRAGRAWVAERFNTLNGGRRAILRALEPLKVMGGSGAMYVMAELPHPYREADQDVARTLVRDYGVAVIPGSFCGFPGWIRVCYSNLPPDLCLKGNTYVIPLEGDMFLSNRASLAPLCRLPCCVFLFLRFQSRSC